MERESTHFIPVADLVREVIDRLKAAEWYFIGEILAERADQLERGNWITGFEDAEALPHNDPATLRGVAFIARVVAGWIDKNAADWSGVPQEEIPREVHEKIMAQIDSWRIVEDAKDIHRRLFYGKGTDSLRD